MFFARYQWEKLDYITVTYGSFSQTGSQCDNFFKILSNIQEVRSTFADIPGDFNARSKSWWYMDITSSEGSQIDSLTATYCLWDFISDPIHTLPSSSTCIDLIISDQPSLIVNNGVHPSLHTNISHQITYSMFNLIIEYPPLYQPLVWE